MASNPPGQCCTIGVKHEGEAQGEIKNVGDVPTYFSYPKDKSTANAVLILTDVIGHGFINAQLYDIPVDRMEDPTTYHLLHRIADQFAANGYFTVMPDLFHGDPVPLNRPADFDIMQWLQGPPGHLPNRVDPVVDAAIKELKNNLGVKKLGLVGYCFGGKYVARFLKKGVADAGYTAHPSFVDPDELKGIEGPLSIAAAETDQIFPAPKRRETEDILKEMNIPYQLTLYSDVEHGFAVRADISKKPVKWAKEQAFIQAVQWFDEHVKA
ncbi:MAG: hypothetical protein M1820_001562 [Bogoriella megaspora]|nr:MAG: hypothetical protein M1820_001562 [Bogoriella megaspora]